jgi:hypothetical protein
MNTAAIVISFAAAFHFALGQVLTQFGLRHVSPLSGAAISIPTFTLVFLCAAEDLDLLKNLPQTRGAPLVELTYHWDEEK